MPLANSSGFNPMVRWVAFDDESAEAVVSRFKRGAAEIQHGDPVGSALTLGRPSLVLLPAGAPGRVLVARFEPKPEENLPPSEANEPAAFEATGFLGLNDQPVFTQPDPPTKKKWWQKLTA
jgi:hypothetical protein